MATEVVVGLDERLAGRRAEYLEFADQVIVLPSGPVEGNLAEVHSACSQEWIFRIDSDEMASPALAAKLPGLLSSIEVRQFAVARRWIAADGRHWFDEAPWWPDFQVRLVRKAGTSFTGTLHSSAELARPRAFAIEPLLHLDCALLSLEQRQEKVLAYEASRATGLGTLRESIVRIYEPERFAELPPTRLDRNEGAQVAAFVRLTGKRGSSLACRQHVRRRTKAPPARSSLSTDDEVRLDPLERDMRFTAETVRHFCAEVTNLGKETWTRDATYGEGTFLAYRWRWPDGSHEEGRRTPFPVTLGPGDSCVAPVDVEAPARTGVVWLDLAVVDEHVRWLPGERRVEAMIQPSVPLPERRESPVGGVPSPRRRRRTSVAIPRVFHRVWLGDAAMPPRDVAFAQTWQRHHPRWEMRLWTDADAPTPAGIERARNVGERADLVRYEILRRHGGVYVDTDVECLRPFDELLAGVTAFAAYEVPGRLCNAVIGATPGHPAFARATELATITVGRGTYPEATATRFLTYVLERSDGVTLFGPERFYPVLWDGRANVGDEPPYAVHHWAKSWQPA